MTNLLWWARIVLDVLGVLWIVVGVFVIWLVNEPKPREVKKATVRPIRAPAPGVTKGKTVGR